MISTMNMKMPMILIMRLLYTDYDSDATLPFMGVDDEHVERSQSGRILRPPARLNDYVRK